MASRSAGAGRGQLEPAATSKKVLSYARIALVRVSAVLADSEPSTLSRTTMSTTRWLPPAMRTSSFTRECELYESTIVANSPVVVSSVTERSQWLVAVRVGPPAPLTWARWTGPSSKPQGGVDIVIRPI